MDALLLSQAIGGRLIQSNQKLSLTWIFVACVTAFTGLTALNSSPAAAAASAPVGRTRKFLPIFVAVHAERLTFRCPCSPELASVHVLTPLPDVD